MSKIACEFTRVVRHRNLKNEYFSLTLSPFSRISSCRPGQFVHVELPHSDIFFRRAFSIASVSEDNSELELIYKVFGRGTRLLSSLRKDDPVSLLGPIGVPFRPPRKNQTAVMVAGGIGFPPLLYLATDLINCGFDPGRIEFFYGGRSKKDLIEQNRIKKLGVRYHPVTEDGSVGEKGMVTGPVTRMLELTNPGKPVLYSCGPEPLLKAVNSLGQQRQIHGQLAIEAAMPCGIGVCLGCVVQRVAGGYARVCVDGPVFDIGEIAL